MVRGRVSYMSRDGEMKGQFLSLCKNQVLCKPQNSPVHWVAMYLGHIAARQTRVCPSKEPWFSCVYSPTILKLNKDLNNWKCSWAFQELSFLRCLICVSPYCCEVWSRHNYSCSHRQGAWATGPCMESALAGSLVLPCPSRLVSGLCFSLYDPRPKTRADSCLNLNQIPKGSQDFFVLFFSWFLSLPPCPPPPPASRFF